MRVARAGQTEGDRRRIVCELLAFIRDFSGLDTTILIEKAHADFEFIEAAEAVLQTAVGPWRSVDAMRDFCVQALIGLTPPTPDLVERIFPRHRTRVSPFAVPFELLRATVPHRGSFDVSRLRTLNKVVQLELTGHSPSAGDNVIVPREEWWLITSMWGRAAIAPLNRDLCLEVWDEGANRRLYSNPLEATFADVVPCFWVITPSNCLRTQIYGSVGEFVALYIVMEGWTYSS